MPLRYPAFAKKIGSCLLLVMAAATMAHAASPGISLDLPSSVPTNAPFTIEVTATDSDGDLNSMGLRYQGVGIIKHWPSISGSSYSDDKTVTAPGSAGTINFRGEVFDDATNGTTGSWYSVNVFTNHEPEADISPSSTTLFVDQSGTWDFSAEDDDDNLKRWRFYFSTNSNPQWTNISGGSEDDDYSTSFGSTGNHTFVLDVEDTSGDEDTDTASVTVVDGPSSSSASSVTNSGFTANWSSAASATSYYLDVSTNNQFTSYVDDYENRPVGNVTSYAVTGLDDDTDYYYRVRAKNSWPGYSKYSNVTSVTTDPDPPPPSAPTAYAPANVSDTGMSARWQTVSGATNYRLDVSTSENFGSYVSGYQNRSVGDVGAYYVSGLSPGTTYHYRVRAENTWGQSDSSQRVTIMLPLGTSPVWLDVNEDGILDEVSPSGSNTYENIIDEVWIDYPEPDPFVEAFFDWYDFFWPEGFWFPEFSYTWSVVPDLGPYTTYTRLAHGFTAEPDYTYEVWGSRVGGSVWQKEWGPITLTILDNLNVGFTTGNYDPDDLLESAFYLVKFSKPIGSLKIEDLLGNVLVENIDAGNSTAVDLLLPSSGEVTLKLRDTLNNYLPSAHQVAWQIKDLLGNILRNGTGLNVDFDGLPLGLAQIVLTLDLGTPKTMKVHTRTFTVQKVEFVDALANFYDWNTNFASSGSPTTFAPKGWELGGENNPVVIQKGKSQPILNVTVSVDPSITSYVLRGFNPNLGLTFVSGQTTRTSSSQVVQVQAQSGQSLPAYVGSIQHSLQWSLQLDSEFIQSDNFSGPHKIYLNWGSSLPSGVASLKRVDWALAAAQGATTEVGIADAIYEAVEDGTAFGGNSDEDWALLDPSATGDCDDMAELMKKAFEMITANSATVRLVIASTEAGAGECLLTVSQGVRTRPGPNGPEYLILYYPNHPSGLQWHTFQAVCDAASKYYATGIGDSRISEADDYAVLAGLINDNALEVEQWWVNTVDDVEPTGAEPVAIEGSPIEQEPLPLP